MKLTKEECGHAIVTLATRGGDENEFLSLYAYFKNEIDCLLSLINEHFDNPPLKFDELEKGMWIWDNKNKCWLYLFKPLDWEPIKGLRYAERIIEYSAEGYYMDFEEGRFYKRQVE